MKRKYFVIFILASVFILNYSYLDSQLIKAFDNSERGIVERVIDGDTIVINGTSVRLLGINAPEKREKYSLEAKNFLEDLVLGKEVSLHFGKDKYDMYKRKLSYVLIESTNINLELVKKGYANIYFPSGKDSYYKKFQEGWNECLDGGENLCEKSFENCIVLEEWNVKEQLVILKNVCSSTKNLTSWSLKDEGRKKYIFPETILYGYNKIILTKNDFEEDYVWTSSGDSLFLRDTENKLVLTESY